MKINQTKLAQMAGVERLTISNYENQKSQPTIEILAALAKALKTSVSFLSGEIDYEGPLDNELVSAMRFFEEGNIESAMEIMRKRARKKRNNG